MSPSELLEQVLEVGFNGSAADAIFVFCVCVCVYAVPSRLGVGIKEDIRRSPLVGLLTQNQEKLCTSSHRALVVLIVADVVDRLA